MIRDDNRVIQVVIIQQTSPEVRRLAARMSKYINRSSLSEPVLTLRQQRFKMLMGYVPEPNKRRFQGGLLGLLEKLR